MGIPLKHPWERDDVRYTYADYCAWDTPERYELIDGVPYLMSPAPGVSHQRIVNRVIIREFAKT